LLVAHLVHLARELDYHVDIIQVAVSEIHFGMNPNEIDYMELVDSWPADTRVNGFDMDSTLSISEA